MVSSPSFSAVPSARRPSAAFRSRGHRPTTLSRKPSEILSKSKEFGGLGVVDYYGYRYYHTELGRWISRDPIGEEGGVNLYRFVKNNGASEVDFVGLQTTLPGNGGFEHNDSIDENSGSDVSHMDEVTVENGCCKCRFTVTYKFTPIKGRIFAPSFSYTKQVLEGGPDCHASIGQPVPTEKPKFNFGGENPMEWDWVNPQIEPRGDLWTGRSDETNGDLHTKPGYTKGNKINIDLKEMVFCRKGKDQRPSDGVLHSVFSWP